MRRYTQAITRRLRKHTLGPLPDDPALARPKSPLNIDLSGKVALVTGRLASWVARTLAACGARVAIHYVTKRDVAERLCEEMNTNQGRACIVSGDAAELDNVSAMRESIEDKLGPVDIVINNGITWFERRPTIDQTADQFERVFRSSVLQAWATARVFAPRMIERKWGRFISLNSEVASQATEKQAPYTAAKCAMDGMARSLARELGEHGITVNSVAPGWVISDKDRKWRTEVEPDYERGIPLRRRGYDQDVANMIAFLASDLAAFITGVRIPVCGGNIMLEA